MPDITDLKLLQLAQLIRITSEKRSVNVDYAQSYEDFVKMCNCSMKNVDCHPSTFKNCPNCPFYTK